MVMLVRHSRSRQERSRDRGAATIRTVYSARKPPAKAYSVHPRDAAFAYCHLGRITPVADSSRRERLARYLESCSNFAHFSPLPYVYTHSQKPLLVLVTLGPWCRLQGADVFLPNLRRYTLKCLCLVASSVIVVPAAAVAALDAGMLYLLTCLLTYPSDSEWNISDSLQNNGCRRFGIRRVSSLIFDNDKLKKKARGGE